MPNTQELHPDARVLELFRVLFRLSSAENEAASKAAEDYDLLLLMAVLDYDELALISRRYGLFTGVSEGFSQIYQSLGIRYGGSAKVASAWTKLRAAANVPLYKIKWTNPADF